MNLTVPPVLFLAQCSSNAHLSVLGIRSSRKNLLLNFQSFYEFKLPTISNHLEKNEANESRITAKYVKLLTESILGSKYSGYFIFTKRLLKMRLIEDASS